MTERRGYAPVAVFDERELAVLRGLAGGSDKEIARTLALSVHGVRYHVRKIFRKLGVRRREEAVRQARALGLLPGERPPGPGDPPG